MAAPSSPRALPEPNTNNVWFSYTGSETVLIFLHGIFSNSRDCWLYSEPAKRRLFSRKPAAQPREVYWPNLIVDDEDFRGIDIFLAGFHTALDSRDFGLAQCALHVFQGLNMPSPPAQETVMSRKNLIFVGHSTGGIVARYILERNQKAFQEKNVGIVLIASPSTGSAYADLSGFLADIYGNELAQLLCTDNPLLRDLDDRFEEMVSRRAEHIPNLIGATACEHHMVFRKKIFGRFTPAVPLFVRKRVVDPDAAGRYFPPTRMIAGSDHFSVVKPPAATHDTHRFLHYFWHRFKKEFVTRPSADTRPSKPELAPAKPTEPIVGREDVVAKAKERLLSGERCALYGSTDVGKTFIAQHLIHDAELREAFPDGALWFSLSPEKEAGALFAAWADALGIARHSVAQLKRLEDRAVAVANAVGQRKLLVFVDHCEDSQTSFLLRIVGPACACLLTSRTREIANSFAGSDGSIEMGPLAQEHRVALLSLVAPELAADPATVLKLAASIGGIAGDLVAVAKMLEGIKDPAKRDELVSKLIARNADGD